MDLEKLRSARSLYYQCLGELFIFSFSKHRLHNLRAYLQLMRELLFDESLRSNFEVLLENLKDREDLKVFYEEYDRLFTLLKDGIPTSFSYIEEGFENSKALLSVREILAKSTIRRNETVFKESEDSVGFCFILMGEFIKNAEDELARQLFQRVINHTIDDFLTRILSHLKARLYKEIANITHAFMEFERSCFELEKPILKPLKKVQNNLSRSEFLRRQRNKERK